MREGGWRELGEGVREGGWRDLGEGVRKGGGNLEKGYSHESWSRCLGNAFVTGHSQSSSGRSW